MATDAIVVTQSSFVEINTAAMTPVVQFAPLQPGRSYLVWGMGHAAIGQIRILVELEAFDAKDKIELVGPELGAFHSFALAVGTTLPADDDLFTVAKVSAALKFELPPGDTTDVVLVTARLVVLAVDILTVQGT